MMKWLFLLALAGCAHGPEDSLSPSNLTQDAEASGPKVDTPSRQVKVCEVIGTHAVRDCTLYELVCEAGELEFVLLCKPVNLGFPTNPPRPVSGL